MEDFRFWLMALLIMIGVAVGQWFLYCHPTLANWFLER
jgi:hypothetical protein